MIAQRQTEFVRRKEANLRAHKEYVDQFAGYRMMKVRALFSAVPFSRRLFAVVALRACLRHVVWADAGLVRRALRAVWPHCFARGVLRCCAPLLLAGVLLPHSQLLLPFLYLTALHALRAQMTMEMAMEREAQHAAARASKPAPVFKPVVDSDKCKPECYLM